MVLERNAIDSITFFSQCSKSWLLTSAVVQFTEKCAILRIFGSKDINLEKKLKILNILSKT